MLYSVLPSFRPKKSKLDGIFNKKEERCKKQEEEKLNKEKRKKGKS